MRVERLSTALILILGAGLGLSQMQVQAQELQADPMEARVWLDRGHEPVLQRGETARLYYRVSEDAFVAIFHIDTNGTTRIVFPNSPQENHFARGGRDYRVLFPGSSYWFVDEDPGMGYFFIVASPEPFSFADLRYSHYGGGWDLSFVGRQVYRDPYLAMDDYVATLIPDWEFIPYGLDFTSYNVDQRHEYPRFMCYDCHGFRPYSSWNPYHYSCASVRMVIYNDPYYYPVTRYRGTRVVYVQPRRGTAHFSFKERAVGEPGTPQVVVRNPPSVSQPGVAGTANRRSQPRNSAPVAGSGNNAQPRSVNGSSARGATGGKGSTAQRRTSGPAVPLTQPSARTSVPRTSAGNGRPVLERRPTSGSSATSRTKPPASGTRTVRPSTRVRGSGTAATRSTVRSGGSATSRPAVRSGGNTIGRSTVRSGGSRPTTTRPTVRSGGTSRTSVSRPAARSSGSSRTTVRPNTSRSGGSARSAPARTSRPPAARSGGSSRSTPARASRPPVKRRSGGGRGG